MRREKKKKKKRERVRGREGRRATREEGRVWRFSFAAGDSQSGPGLRSVQKKGAKKRTGQALGAGWRAGAARVTGAGGGRRPKERTKKGIGSEENGPLLFFALRPRPCLSLPRLHPTVPGSLHHPPSLSSQTHPVEGAGDHVDLQPVAGGQDASLRDMGEERQLLNRAGHLRLRHRQLLPDLHGRVVDGQADGDDGGLLLGRVA